MVPGPGEGETAAPSTRGSQRFVLCQRMVVGRYRPQGAALPPMLVPREGLGCGEDGIAPREGFAQAEIYQAPRAARKPARNRLDHFDGYRERPNVQEHVLITLVSPRPSGSGKRRRTLGAGGR